MQVIHRIMMKGILALKKGIIPKDVDNLRSALGETHFFDFALDNMGRETRAKVASNRLWTGGMED